MSYVTDFLPAIIDFMNDDPCYGTYKQFLQGSYDPTTSQYSTTEVDTQVQVLLLDMTRNSNGLSSIFGKEILAGDKECYLLPPERADPLAVPLVINTLTDRLVIAGIEYKIVDMKSADPTGAASIVYQLMLRRGQG